MAHARGVLGVAGVRPVVQQRPQIDEWVAEERATADEAEDAWRRRSELFG